MSERQKLELSFSGVAAGALATITATVVASFFGAYGTIIGAAASSVVSTAGAAIYQHFFRRTGDKLKEAGQHLSASGLRTTLVSERGGAVTVTAADPRQPRQRRPEQPDRPDRPQGRTESRSTRPSRPRTLADVMGEDQGRTTARIGDEKRDQAEGPGDAASVDGPGSGEAERSLGAFAERPEGDHTEVPGAFSETGDAKGGEREDGTRVMGAAGVPGISGDPDDETNLAGTEDAETMAINRMTGVSEVYTASGAKPPERPGLGVMLEWARARWPKLLVGSITVFVLVMGAVTAIEAIMDKPLSAAVTGKDVHGTTLTGGNGRSSTDTPTDSPSVTGSPSPTDQPTGSTPGNTAPSTPNPRQTAQNPGQTDQPVQPSGQPTTQPSTQSSTGGENGNNAQGQNATQPPATE